MAKFNFDYMVCICHILIYCLTLNDARRTESNLQAPRRNTITITSGKYHYYCRAFEPHASQIQFGSSFFVRTQFSTLNLSDAIFHAECDDVRCNIKNLAKRKKTHQDNFVALCIESLLVSIFGTYTQTEWKTR